MPPVYAATAPEWLQTIRTLPKDTEIAFWQPTPAEPKRIALGERWYFKERGQPVIRGFGLFRGWEALTLSDLYRRYGTAAGYSSEDELVSGMQVFRGDASASTIVGNVRLIDFVEYEPPIHLTEVGLEDLTVRFRYLGDGDPLASTSNSSPEEPSPPSPEVVTHAPTERSGPTTGITPTDWTRSVGHSSEGAAFTYALRFSGYDIWKIGWTVDVKKRLRLINDHIPSEIVKGKWSCIFAEPMSSKRRAYEMEQFVLNSLSDYRTQGERLNCPEKELSSVWLNMIQYKKERSSRAQ